MFYKLVGKDEFYSAINIIKYRINDIREAHEFGAESIKVCYDRANHNFAKYYIVYEDNGVPIVTVMLQRDGNLVFFISGTVSSPIALIKLLKGLANNTVANIGAIFTKTINWYNEAIRLNGLIGFRLYQRYDSYDIYVKDI